MLRLAEGRNVILERLYFWIVYFLDRASGYTLTQIGVTLKEFFDIGSGLHSINQLHQPRVWLQPLSSILNQILIMAQLEKYQIRICDIIADDEWSPAGEFWALQMGFDSFGESVSIALLMLRIIYLLIIGEERRNKECSPFSKHQLPFLFQQ